MQRGRRDSVAFTVVVAALVLLGGVVMAVVIALSGAPGSLALAALLASVVVPVAATSLGRLAATSLGLLLLGITLLHVHRVDARVTPAPSLQPEVP